MLSRVDGKTPVDVMCAITGLTEEATVAALEALQSKGLIVLEQDRSTRSSPSRTDHSAAQRPAQAQGRPVWKVLRVGRHPLHPSRSARAAPPADRDHPRAPPHRAGPRKAVRRFFVSQILNFRVTNTPHLKDLVLKINCWKELLDFPIFLPCRRRAVFVEPLNQNFCHSLIPLAAHSSFQNLLRNSMNCAPAILSW